MSSTRSAAIRNVFWVTVAQGGRTLVQFAGTIFFSHMLLPSDFGLLALAMVVMNFAYLLRDMGTSSALIQRTTITDDFVNTVFWANIVFGLTLAFIVASTSFAAADLFDEKRLTKLLLVLSIVFPIAAAGAPHLALMERDSQFRKIALLEVTSALLGFTFACVAAWAGLGVYSLVLQTLVTATASTIQLWFVSVWRPTWRWHKAEFLSLAKFSGNLVGFNIANYLTRNADSMLIGRYLGPADLGIYSVAYRIMLLPLQNLTYVSNRALLPIYSRQQADSATMSKAYLKTLRIISLIVAPLMAALWVLRSPFINLVLGPHWAQVANILAWFAPMGFIQAILSTTGSILIARGRTDILRRLGVLNSLTIVSSFVIGLFFGTEGVACSYFFAVLIVALISLHVTLTQVGLTFFSLLYNIWPALLSTLAMTGAMMLLDQVATDGLPDVARLALLMPVGAIVYSVSILLISKTALEDLRMINLFGVNK